MGSGGLVVVLGLDVYLDLHRRMSAPRCWAGCTQTQSAWCQGTLGTGEESSLCHTMSPLIYPLSLLKYVDDNIGSPGGMIILNHPSILKLSHCYCYINPPGD